MNNRRPKARGATWEVIAMLVVVCIAAGIWTMQNRGRPPAADARVPPIAVQTSAVASAPRAPSPPTTAPSVMAADQWRQIPVGRWLRLDGGYILTISSIGEDGLMDAAYNNPRPIHVAQAKAGTKEGKIAVYVELRDRNYPGNFYTLTYDSAHDALTGEYHHLGLGQVFDVSFGRMSKEVTAKQ